MGAGSGFALKLLQWFNRGVQFACSGLILALTSYFLAVMSNHSITIPTSLRAVEGIAGVGVLYTGLGILLVCCLAGFTLTSFLAMLLDVAFIGAYIYVATVYRDGASSCTGSNVQTVFGSGDATAQVSSTQDGGVPLPSYRSACRMESANFAVAIVAIVFFVISALTEFALGRHRKKAQRFGPSPSNNYTSGYGFRSGGGLFGRFRRNKTNDAAGLNPNSLPEHTSPDQLRQSYATEQTHVDDSLPMHTNGYNKYGESGYAQPATTGVAPAAANNQYRYGDGTYNV